MGNRAELPMGFPNLRKPAERTLTPPAAGTPEGAPAASAKGPCERVALSARVAARLLQFVIGKRRADHHIPSGQSRPDALGYSNMTQSVLKRLQEYRTDAMHANDWERYRRIDEAIAVYIGVYSVPIRVNRFDLPTDFIG